METMSKCQMPFSPTPRASQMAKKRMLRMEHQQRNLMLKRKDQQHRSQNPLFAKRDWGDLQRIDPQIGIRKSLRTLPRIALRDEDADEALG
tara:strand:- start:210 stop:482 length:273 start_codon:yes stop_codon:yes gene_type:complete